MGIINQVNVYSKKRILKEVGKLLSYPKKDLPEEITIHNINSPEQHYTLGYETRQARTKMEKSLNKS